MYCRFQFAINPKNICGKHKKVQEPIERFRGTGLRAAFFVGEESP